MSDPERAQTSYPLVPENWCRAGGLVVETAHGPIALFKTGPCHAGEHLAEVLDRCDASAGQSRCDVICTFDLDLRLPTRHRRKCHLE